MSGDEVFALVVSGILTCIIWGRWAAQAMHSASNTVVSRDRLSFDFVPAVCLLALLAVLRFFSSHDVRNSTLYLSFYMVLGAAWLGASQMVFTLGGLSARDDIFERHNPAAVPAIAGLFIGITACFAGGNIGDGPGWWVVIFAAGLATVSLLLLWLVVDRSTALADAITIDRDFGAGLRAGGFLTGAGLILGRSVAGDWIAAESTVRDFAGSAWMAAGLALTVLVLERIFRSSLVRDAPVLIRGWLPGVSYITAGVLAVWRMGWWK